MGLSVASIFVLYIVLTSESMFGDGFMPGWIPPFEFVMGNYSDFESRAIDIQSQYCGKVCNQRFKLKPYINFRCAPCFCDEECYIFNDCCPDKVLFEKNKAFNTKGFGCTQTLFGNYTNFTKVIDNCPQDYEDVGIAENCLQNDSLHWRYIKPTTDLTTNITYKNTFCAQCNGVREAKGWSTETECKSTSNYGNSNNVEDIYFSVINNVGCFLTFVPPEGARSAERRCHPLQQPFYNRCNQTGLWSYYDEEVERACLLYTNVVLGKYRNVFCRLCNEEINWLDLKNEPMGNIIFAKFSLASLMDLRDDQEPKHTALTAAALENTFDNNTECEVDELLDSSNCSCVSKTCSEREILVNGECQSIFPKSNNIGYEIRMCIQGSYNGEGAWHEYIEKVWPEWNTDTDVVTYSSFTPVHLKRCGSGVVEIQVEAVVRIIFSKLVNTDEKQADLVRKAQLVGSLGGCYSRTQLSTDKEKNGCAYLKSNSSIVHEPVNQTLEVYFPRFTFVNLSKLMTCTQVLVDKTKCVPIDNRTVHLLHNNKILLNTDYEVRDTNYAICVEDFSSGMDRYQCKNNTNNSKTKTKVDNTFVTPMGLTSLVSSCVSLLFLFVSFLFYCICKSMRNLVGVNIMGLIIALFFAQFVYEFGMELTEYPGLCITAGILNHYFWLSSTFWMNSCTFLLFYKLSFPLKSRSFQTMTVFIKSFAYATLSPAAIVGCTLAVNMAMEGKLGYGGTFNCFIQNVNVRRFAFALPLGLLIFTNVVLFVSTLLKVRTSQFEAANNKDTRINIVSCFKLSVITGALWIFAFIYEATRIQIFAYLFTILVGTQGVMIFCAFILNKRVYHMCKEMIWKKEHSHSGNSDKTRKYVAKSSTETPVTRLSSKSNTSESGVVEVNPRVAMSP